MTPAQIRSSIDWYRNVGDGSIRVFFKDGRCETGRVTRVTDSGFRLDGVSVSYDDVDAAESGCFA